MTASPSQLARHAEWCALYRGGLNLREIAAAYGVTHMAVRYALLKNGVRLRKTGRRWVVARV